MNEQDDFIQLGVITGFFGVKGWVKLHSYTRPSTGIMDYRQFYCGLSHTPIHFSAFKESGKNIVGHIKGIDSREMAERFLREPLFVKRSDLPQLEGEYYWHDLIGLTVINQTGETLGKIDSMMETGANDVMVIKNAAGDEILIPFVLQHFIHEIDLAAGKLYVDWLVDEA